MLKEWIPVFKTGTWTDMLGRTAEYMESKIDSIIESTKNLGLDLIPFTIDHPKNNLPIYGRFSKNDIRKAKYGNDWVIEVKPMEFADGFIDALKELGRKEISIAHDENMCIQHIGFVTKGAVKDLPNPFAFSEFNDNNTVIDIPVNSLMFEDDMMSSMRDMLSKMKSVLSKMGMEDKEKIKQEIKMEIMSMSEKVELENKIAEMQKVLDKEKEQRAFAENELIKQKNELEKQKEEVKSKEYSAFLDSVSKKFKPADRETLINIMKRIDKDGELVKFSSGQEVNIYDGFKAFMQSLPDKFNNPIATTDTAAIDSSVLPEKYKKSSKEEEMLMYSEAKKIQELEKCTFEEAVKKIYKMKG